MPTHAFTTEAQRVGTIKGEMLKHAVPREVLGITGNQHQIKKNMGETVIYRRWLPFGGTDAGAVAINTWAVTPSEHLTQEGVTPDADTLVPQDISVTIRQYSCLYMYTDKTAELYEDDVPAGMTKQCGQRMGLVREKIRYGALKACTNVSYAGGTTRATVDETISLNLLRSTTRTLIGNRCDLITQILSASPNYSTTPIEAGFLVFCHSDMEHDIRELPGFTPCAEYGHMKPMHPLELGAADRYRFIISPELSAITDAGLAVGATGLKTSGTKVDVYPVIVVADDAWGDVALRGASSFQPHHLPHTMRSKDDPLNQRGYIGCKFWSAVFIQNDGWMAVLECGATDL